MYSEIAFSKSLLNTNCRRWAEIFFTRVRLIDGSSTLCGSFARDQLCCARSYRVQITNYLRGDVIHARVRCFSEPVMPLREFSIGSYKRSHYGRALDPEITAK